MKKVQKRIFTVLFLFTMVMLAQPTLAISSACERLSSNIVVGSTGSLIDAIWCIMSDMGLYLIEMLQLSGK